ncbi:putative tricarboxylic transport membrane protein [Polaromonas sp. OV174]|uniref:Bug family tripartite tricarboxylate transporter substrate binding protein n=1 Tax=Polaromonas sp. OV174 TaxID=1855300 RepID=UPI0008F078C5|nr:tripartite tricarboxylate transporter substrate-binding protein [Polaromonas sp. OV174]SFC43520.1 putative tricarboxylic transport membrane protein [Polaromonas sp. OV174]
MLNIKRRNVLGGLGVASLGGAIASPLWAQTAAKNSKVSRLAPRLRMVIPANAGGGWDQTGRALGAALIGAGATDEIDYENKGGKGGTLGLAYYAEKYSNDPNTLLMGGMVMVGAVALQKPVVDMKHIQPVARLTSDYLVVVVAADSPIKSIKELAERMRANPKETPIAGGSAGGVDHVFAGVFTRGARSKPDELVYLPFAGGAEVVKAVLSGKAVAGISGYSEFSEDLASGKLRAIGVSSKRSVFGIPAIREQGVDVDMANWRGVFTGQGVTAARQAEMVEVVKAATAHASWLKALKQNRWESSWLSGPSFNSFIDFDMTTSQVMVHLLKLKA